MPSPREHAGARDCHVWDTFHPNGLPPPRISDRIVFDKLLQLLRFGFSYQAIADTTCSPTNIRNVVTSGFGSGYRLRPGQDPHRTHHPQPARPITHKGEKAPIQASQRWRDRPNRRP